MRNFLKLFLNLRLFDGAAAGGAAASAGGSGAAAGEASTIPSAAGKGKRANPLAAVQYGKQAETAKTATNAAPEAVVQYVKQAETAQTATNAAPETAGPSTQAAAEKPTTTTTSDALEAKKAEFERLIQGEYKDLFSERTQSIIDRRFKETKTLQAQADKTKPILDMLSAKYGVTDGDADTILKAVQDDDSYYEEEASRKGLSVAQLKEMKKVERENVQLKATIQETERRQQAKKVYAGWLNESEQIKTIYPGFNLETETQNPDFLRMLQSGVGVKAAYQAVHMDDIMSGAMQYTAQKIQQQTVNNIKARAERPAENGIASQPGVTVKNDVSKLSAADRREIARRAARGEQIQF